MRKERYRKAEHEERKEKKRRKKRKRDLGRGREYKRNNVEVLVF